MNETSCRSHRHRWTLLAALVLAAAATADTDSRLEQSRAVAATFAFAGELRPELQAAMSKAARPLPSGQPTSPDSSSGS